jgi:hypothetical protein
MNHSTNIVLNNTKEIIVDAHTKQINKILNKGDKIIIYSNSHTKLFISTDKNIIYIYKLVSKYIFFIISYIICIYIIYKK